MNGESIQNVFIFPYWNCTEWNEIIGEAGAQNLRLVPRFLPIKRINFRFKCFQFFRFLFPVGFPVKTWCIGREIQHYDPNNHIKLFDISTSIDVFTWFLPNIMTLEHNNHISTPCLSESVIQVDTLFSVSPSISQFKDQKDSCVLYYCYGVLRSYERSG